MSLGDTPHAELVARLEALLAEARAEKTAHERVVHELGVHQIELELQNRELREVQGALEESRNRYADLYDFAPIAYFTLDRRGVVLEVNLTGATLVGRDRAQLIGAPFTALVALADPAQLWAHLRRCADTRAPVASEFAATIGAAAFHLRAVSSPATDHAGTPIAFRTAFVDVTDRRRAEVARDRAFAAEQALRQGLEALDRAKTVLARALATVTRDSLGVLLQVVVDQARALVGAAYAALGIDGDDAGPFRVWVHSGMAPATAAAIGRTPRKIGTLGAVIHDERPLRIADLSAHPQFAGFPPGHPAMSSFLGVPVWFGERVVGNLYLTTKRGDAEFTDDDQHMIESLSRYVGVAMEIARLGDASQRAIRTRDNLLATVSHDLRSPLSAIAISARLLHRLLAASGDATSLRQAETIGRAAARMTRFVDDLLTASSLEAGALTVSLRPESLAAIAAEALELLAPLAAEREIALTAEIPAGLPSARCDRDRVHQVIANLVGNAIKFTPAGGQIALAAADRGDHVELSVTDSGPGIPAELRAHVFERFWTAGGDAGPPGVGLGLYICRGIVESHGGRIWVDSRPGEGARFAFTLPIAAPPG
jgi:PAS domain S-box-containing protein